MRGVEDVVLDLEGQTEGKAEAVESDNLRGGRAGGHSAEFERGAQEHAGLGGMDEIKRGLGGLASFGFEVGDLSGNETAGSGGASQLGDEVGGRVTRPGFDLGQNGKCFGKECIAGKHSHPLPEDDVRRGFAAAEFVVVHAGKIIVDERVGVNHFHGASGRERLASGAAAGFGRGAAKERAQTLAAGEEAVAHGAMDGRGFGLRRRN